MRLIDADELLKNANRDGAYGYVSAKEIEEAPTAYDVDAVVRELEQDYRDAIKIYGNDADGEYYYGVTRALHCAIRIVKRGGMIK